MDKTTVTTVGPQTWWQQVLESLPQDFWWWVLVAAIVAIVGFWLVSYVSKKVFVGSVLLVIVTTALTFLAAPSLIEYFSKLPPMDFIYGFFIGVATIGVGVLAQCIYNGGVL